jgi:hypothetical protein
MEIYLNYISVFIMVLSILFVGKNIFTNILNFFINTNPQPIKITTVEKVLLYLSLSYIITFLYF